MFDFENPYTTTTTFPARLINSRNILRRCKWWVVYVNIELKLVNFTWIFFIATTVYILYPSEIGRNGQY